MLGFTKFGRIVTAIGSNEEAVRLSGIAVPRYVCAVYVISGALAALAGIISTARAGVGSAQVGVGAELEVIAAVVIGGASLMGGRGGVVNTLLGAMVMGVIAQHHEPGQCAGLSSAGLDGRHHRGRGAAAARHALAAPELGLPHGADMTRDLALSIDVGTGSARAALVDGGGRILAIAAREHEQIVPQFGWSEQRPADWWAGRGAVGPRPCWTRSRARAAASPRSAPAARCTARCWSTTPAP